MNGNARNLIFDAMARALEGVVAPPQTKEERAAQIEGLFLSAGEKRTALFQERMEDAGGTVILCEDLRAFLEWLASFVQEEDIHSIYTNDAESLLGAEWFDAFAGKHVSMNATPHDPSNPLDRELNRELSLASTVGMAPAVAGIADIGAILVASTHRQSRSLSLLTQIHIALLSERDIFDNLLDFETQLSSLLNDSDTGSVTLIGGPSKTADIEKVLVTGVHGPLRLIVAVIKT